MREKVRLLCQEFADWRKLPINNRPDPSILKNAISFSELRELDIFCRNAIAISSPDLAKRWYVMEEKELAGPEEIALHLSKKRVVLVQAISRVDRSLSNKAATGESKKDDKEIVMLKPTFFGVGIDLKALWKKVRRMLKKDGNA